VRRRRRRRGMGTAVERCIFSNFDGLTLKEWRGKDGFLGDGAFSSPRQGGRRCIIESRLCLLVPLRQANTTRPVSLARPSGELASRGFPDPKEEISKI
jgi:hypothetical protein